MDPNYPQALFILKGLNSPLRKKLLGRTRLVLQNSTIPASQFLLVAVTKHHELAGKGVSAANLQSITQGSPGRKPRQGPGGRKGRSHGVTLLTGLFFRLAISYLFYTTQDHLTRGGHHLQWAAPSHQSRKCPVDLPTHQSDGGIFPEEIFSSQMSLSSVKLTIQNKTKQNKQAKTKHQHEAVTPHSHFTVTPVITWVSGPQLSAALWHLKTVGLVYDSQSPPHFWSLRFHSVSSSVLHKLWADTKGDLKKCVASSLPLQSPVTIFRGTVSWHPPSQKFLLEDINHVCNIENPRTMDSNMVDLILIQTNPCDGQLVFHPLSP